MERSIGEKSGMHFDLLLRASAPPSVHDYLDLPERTLSPTGFAYVFRKIHLDKQPDDRLFNRVKLLQFQTCHNSVQFQDIKALKGLQDRANANLNVAMMPKFIGQLVGRSTNLLAFVTNSTRKKDLKLSVSRTRYL